LKNCNLCFQCQYETNQNPRNGSITQTASTDFCAVIGNPGFFNNPSDPIVWPHLTLSVFNHNIHIHNHQSILSSTQPILHSSINHQSAFFFAPAMYISCAFARICAHIWFFYVRFCAFFTPIFQNYPLKTHF
jgi:hypothetical protein